jgi:small subunit ribosomal protein S6
LATQERDPRPYELMTVFIPELSEEDNQAQIERTEGYISSAGGALTETLTSSPWGRRRLAYTIRFNGVDYRDGFYTVFHFDSRPSLLTELERDLKLDTNVMRYLLVHDDPKAGEQFSEEQTAEAEGGEAAGGAVASAAEETTPAETAEAAAESEAPAETAAAAAAPESPAEPAGATTEEAPAQDVEAAAEVAPEPSVETAAETTDDATTEKE